MRRSRPCRPRVSAAPKLAPNQVVLEVAHGCDDRSSSSAPRTAWRRASRSRPCGTSVAIGALYSAHTPCHRCLAGSYAERHAGGGTGEVDDAVEQRTERTRARVVRDQRSVLRCDVTGLRASSVWRVSVATQTRCICGSHGTPSGSSARTSSCEPVRTVCDPRCAVAIDGEEHGTTSWRTATPGRSALRTCVDAAMRGAATTRPLRRACDPVMLRRSCPVPASMSPHARRARAAESMRVSR